MPTKTTERQKIVIGINSLASTSYAAYTNHIQSFYRLGRNYPDIDFILFNPQRMSIDRMRNTAAELALDQEASHLLFWDDDVIVPSPYDFLSKLLACDADIACGDVLIRGYPFNHMIFRWNREKDGLLQMPKVPKKLGPIPVDAVGFSLCLIKTDLLKKVPKPYFITGLTNTEDVYFCLKARDVDPQCKIVCDTSIRCGHILWNEIISADNKQAYSRYHEFLTGGKIKENKEAVARGNEYYRKVRG